MAPCQLSRQRLDNWEFYIKYESGPWKADQITGFDIRFYYLYSGFPTKIRNTVE